jgi:predicted HicB family RNase H-like nuclease
MEKPKKGVKDMKATMFRIEPELHKTLRIAAIEAGISMNEAVKQAVEMWLQKQRKGGKAK